ncbi:DUF4012 domain-containing protein [Bifidobacterium callitrichos]|uniref:DUF4012 domain-containing protein n=2 Tax=Bifidobacterium callitrichos TaxID=762209 RepID=A0A5M9Z9T4_9BIFI|nr:DUF4012 domain-containing protein [Bifidobacterium callitrichos]
MSREHIKRIKRRKRIRIILIIIAVILIALAGVAAWFATSATKAKSEIEAAVQSASGIQKQVSSGDTASAKTSINVFAAHIDAAYAQTRQPVWRLAEFTPYYGSDVKAARDVVSILKDVSINALPKLADSAAALDFDKIGIQDGAIQLGDMNAVAQDLDAANQVISDANVRLNNISGTHIPELTEALNTGKTKFKELADLTDMVTRMADIMPAMFDLDQTGQTDATPRTYLVLAQNNAELRATGGIPTSWSTLTIDQGKLSMGTFSTPPEDGMYSESEAQSVLTPDERNLFSTKMATDYQDINFTPDFPRTAKLARDIWQRAGRGSVDGVISVDPVLLQRLLKITGPVTLANGIVLTGDTAEQIILNQTYLTMSTQSEQNAFFAMTAARVFDHVLHNLSGNNKQLVATIRQAAADGHVYIWSAHEEEQTRIQGSIISGSLSSNPAQPVAGVYFNDGTMSKMDWYLKREVTSTYDKTYPNGAKQYTIRIKLTNTADAAQVNAAPDLLRGYDTNGQPRHGEIETVMYVYAPDEGRLVDWDPQFDQIATHDTLTLGAKTITLQPGESFEATVHVLASPKAGSNALVLRQTPLVD